MTTALNTLYVTLDGAYLHKDHETVTVTVEREKKLQVPLLQLQGIVCLGRVGISPDLMAACTEAHIHVSFFTSTGRMLGRVEGMPGGNVLLRRAQYRVADDAARTLELARAMVAGKIANTRQLLLRARRDGAPEREQALGHAADALGAAMRQAATIDTLDGLRGCEGSAARAYFGVFTQLIKRPEPLFAFGGRSRRPPGDAVNALLSFGYALLLQDVAAALCGVGLDPAVGYLHEERPGRLTLALDVMEELRVPMVDRLVLALINRGQLGESDFRPEASGGVWLSDSGRRTFLTAYQEAKQGEVRHEFLQQSATWGRVAHWQALLLARVLRGDLEAYPPFVMR